MVNKARGRPAGGRDTRSAILDAARVRFLAHGYAATSVRAIARDADVDHALVNYYFRSKQALFGEVMALSLTPAHMIGVVVPGNDRDLARAVLTSLLTAWDDPVHGAPLVAMMSEATSDPQVGEAVRGYLQDEIFPRVVGLTGAQRTTERAAAVTAVLSGVVFARYLLRLEPLASMRRDAVARAVAPALRAALDLPPRSAPRRR